MLEAPVRPGKVLCSGINYKGHAEENPNAKMPTEPFFFAKLPTSVVGPGTPGRQAGAHRADGLRGGVLGSDRQAAAQGRGSRRDAGDLRLHAAQRHFGTRRAVQGQPDHHRQELCRLRADRPMHRHGRCPAPSRQRRAEDPAQRQAAAGRQHVGLAVLAAAPDHASCRTTSRSSRATSSRPERRPASASSRSRRSS